MGQIASFVFNLILIVYSLLSICTCQIYLSIFTCCIANIKFSSYLFVLYKFFCIFLFCFLVKIKYINECILLNVIRGIFSCENWFLSWRMMDRLHRASVKKSNFTTTNNKNHHHHPIFPFGLQQIWQKALGSLGIKGAILVSILVVH